MINDFWGSSAPRLGSQGYLSAFPANYTSMMAYAPTVDMPSTSKPGGLFDRGFFDSKGADGITQQGWGMPALGAAKGIFDSWMAMKSYGLAKQQLAEGKRQFGLNFEAQRSTLNSQLEDRQRARVASNPGAYQSVGDYMNKNSIKGG